MQAGLVWSGEAGTDPLRNLATAADWPGKVPFLLSGTPSPS